MEDLTARNQQLLKELRAAKTKARRLERELQIERENAARAAEERASRRSNTPPASPRKSGSKPGSPTGEIPKQRRGSKSRTPPSTPVSPSIVKRRGRLVADGTLVIPEGVLDGHSNRFPTLNRPTSKGLWNKGRFCCRNATLQGLLHLPAFYRYLGKMHKDCKRHRQRCVVCALQYLAHAYWNVPEVQVASVPGRVRGSLGPLKDFNSACRNNIPDRDIFEI